MNSTQPLGPTSHSIVGMSVLSRRLGCPGSANAERGLPDRPSEAATRGTARSRRMCDRPAGPRVAMRSASSSDTLQRAKVPAVAVWIWRRSRSKSTPCQDTITVEIPRSGWVSVCTIAPKRQLMYCR